MKTNIVHSEACLIRELVEKDFHFIHQYPFKQDDRYWTADFYLPDHNLVIEVDGAEHLSTYVATNDREKESRMTMDFSHSVVRFSNQQAKENTQSIIEFILSHDRTKTEVFDMRIKREKPTPKKQSEWWNSIPIEGNKDGEVLQFRSIAKACEHYGIKAAHVTVWFSENKDKTTYTSKSGITITKTVLI